MKVTNPLVFAIIFAFVTAFYLINLFLTYNQIIFLTLTFFGIIIFYLMFCIGKLNNRIQCLRFKPDAIEVFDTATMNRIIDSNACSLESHQRSIGNIQRHLEDVLVPLINNRRLTKLEKEELIDLVKSMRVEGEYGG